jgi:hypothetical protein
MYFFGVKNYNGGKVKTSHKERKTAIPIWQEMEGKWYP